MTESRQVEATANGASRYLRKLKTLPLLSQEEVMRLATEYRETGNPALAHKLVEGHLRLVVKIARECCSRPSLLPDLIQEGSLGLMKAIEKFDPTRGVRLSSYAAWWIRAYIYQFIMSNVRMVKIATTCAQRKLFFSLNRERGRLEGVEGEGSENRLADLAQRLGVSEEDVAEMERRLGGQEVLFDTTAAGDADIANEYSSSGRPDEEVERQEYRAWVHERLCQFGEQLKGRDRLIFEKRLVAEQPITLRELGQRCGVSRERARQLEERLKKQIRALLETPPEGQPQSGRGDCALAA